MSVAYLIHDQSKTYFVTLTITKWVNILTRPDQKMIISDSLNYCVRSKGLQIFAYVIMTNHMHMICGADENSNLSDIIRDFKKHTAKKLIQTLDNDGRREWILNILGSKRKDKSKSYKVWQRGYHAIEVSSNKFLDQKIEYIHNNPVREMIVQNPEEYLFSSARNYAGMDRYVDVIVTPGKWKTYC